MARLIASISLGRKSLRIFWESGILTVDVMLSAVRV
jgi:hypothetical protein